MTLNSIDQQTWRPICEFTAEKNLTNVIHVALDLFKWPIWEHISSFILARNHIHAKFAAPGSNQIHLKLYIFMVIWVATLMPSSKTKGISVSPKILNKSNNIFLDFGIYKRSNRISEFTLEKSLSAAMNVISSSDTSHSCDFIYEQNTISIQIRRNHTLS